MPVVKHAYPDSLATSTDVTISVKFLNVPKILCLLTVDLVSQTRACSQLVIHSAGTVYITEHQEIAMDKQLIKSYSF